MDAAVFHPGIQHSWQTALALQLHGRLAWFATSIYRKPRRFPFILEKLPDPLGARLEREFSRFCHPGIDPGLVITPGGAIEWLERLASRASRFGLARELNAYGNRRFADGLERRIAGPESFALWGYNSAAGDAFEAGQERGRACILDRTIGDWRYFNTQIEHIRETHGDWFVPGVGLQKPRRIAEDDHEYALADTILCGSEFAARTIRDFSPVDGIASKIQIVPYGIDADLYDDQPPPVPAQKNEPVRFLFTGLASLRKGIHHVLEAIAQLPAQDATLTIVGQVSIPAAIMANYAERITHIPTVPRAEMPALMARHHVLLLPSYFEGSSIALREGMRCGLAPIQTRQAGDGADAQSGIVLPMPSTPGVLEAMRKMIDQPDQREAMRRAAYAQSSAFSFAGYAGRVLAVLDGIGA